MARKAKKTLRERVVRRLAGAGPGAALREVDDLAERGRLAEAAARLAELAERYPRDLDVAERQVAVSAAGGDHLGLEKACRRLLRLAPEHPTARLQLSHAHNLSGRPLLALNELRAFVAGHAAPPPAANLIADLERIVAERLDELGLAGNSGLATLAASEEAGMLWEHGELDAALAAFDRLGRIAPDFVPGLNNRSQVEWVAGNRPGAIDWAERVLARDPDNAHALSNLVRYLFLSGRADEAEPYADRLCALRPGVDGCVKQAEAMSYLGDDAAVLAAYDRATREAKRQRTDVPALLLHLAAVVKRRGGDVRAARRLWEKALEFGPPTPIMLANLADLELPPGEQQGPWPFEVPDWLGLHTIRDLTRLTRLPSGRIDKNLRKQFADRPEVVALVPALLARGDRLARDLVLVLIDGEVLPATAEAIEAVVAFVFGRLGSDRLRMRASQVAQRRGWLASGTYRMWQEGKPTDVLLMGIEIHGEPLRAHPPRVVRHLQHASECLDRGDAAAAQAEYERAMAIEPDAPDIRFNYAAMLMQEGRGDEALAIVRDLHARHPDYLFAVTALAHDAADRGDVTSARRLLEPLMLRSKMHFGEFGALAAAQIDVALADRDRAAARQWLAMWADLDPEHRLLGHWRRRVGG